MAVLYMITLERNMTLFYCVHDNPGAQDGSIVHNNPRAQDGSIVHDNPGAQDGSTYL